jgi:hypothetical protein
MTSQKKDLSGFKNYNTMQILTRFFQKAKNKHIESVIHNMEPVNHTINDLSSNMLSEPALMYVGGETVGDIKVTMANGDIHTIPNYNWSQSFMVLKVWDTGTNSDVKANIKLYR